VLVWLQGHRQVSAAAAAAARWQLVCRWLAGCRSMSEWHANRKVGNFAAAHFAQPVSGPDDTTCSFLNRCSALMCGLCTTALPAQHSCSCQLKFARSLLFMPLSCQHWCDCQPFVVSVAPVQQAVLLPHSSPSCCCWA
jgi:hypothetical protein